MCVCVGVCVCGCVCVGGWVGGCACMYSTYMYKLLAFHWNSHFYLWLLHLNTDNFMQQFCAVGLGVGIPVSILLSSIISSLLTLLITYRCLTRGKHHKPTPPVQEPVYDPVSSGTSVEMKSNVAYGQVTTGGHATYETVPQ